MNPLAIDLFCGLGGWTEGLLAEDYNVIGFDIEQHQYGDHRYPGKLVVQDVTTLHGSQFRNATLIVASPPCQEYSYMAMPWKLAKAKAAAIRADTTGQMLADLNKLFDVCFRIQKEASVAAGRHIPMVVENVRGAIPWVGRSRWNFGSFHLWGDVPALMPVTAAKSVMKQGIAHRPNGETNFHGHTKNNGGSWFAIGSPGQKVVGKNPVHELAGIKVGNAAERRWEDRPVKRLRDAYDPMWKREFTATAADIVTAALDGAGEGRKGYAKVLGQSEVSRQFGSKSPQRKMASAMIAKIPLPLSRHIAATFRPQIISNNSSTNR